MFSILIWWAIPAGSVVIAAAAAAAARRVRRAKEDVGTLHRYQRAREALARTQNPVQNGAQNAAQNAAPPERSAVSTID